MKKLLLLALLGLAASTTLAQGAHPYDRGDRYDRGNRYDRNWERDRRYDGRRYDRDWDRRDPRYDGGRNWQRGGPPPRLSDMQRRALQNCALLQRRDQPRCRATVMSTVR